MDSNSPDLTNLNERERYLLFAALAKLRGVPFGSRRWQSEVVELIRFIVREERRRARSLRYATAAEVERDEAMEQNRRRPPFPRGPRIQVIDAGPADEINRPADSA